MLINGLWTPNAAAESCCWLEKAHFVAILAKVELHRSPLTAVNDLPCCGYRLLCCVPGLADPGQVTDRNPKVGALASMESMLARAPTFVLRSVTCPRGGLRILSQHQHQLFQSFLTVHVVESRFLEGYWKNMEEQISPWQGMPRRTHKPLPQ